MKKNIFILSVLFLSFSLLQNGAYAASTEGKKGLLALGSQAPDFSLPDVVTGKPVILADFAGKKALLVIFLCRHCPFVAHDKAGFIQLAKDYADKDLAIVAISANDPAAYPADAPASLKEMALADKFPMPVLFDETQETAKAYTAVATPDIFLFNENRKLVYRGQFDDSRPNNDLPVTGNDVRAAINAVLHDSPVAPRQRPAIGCGIKWKDGNEPLYL